MTQATTEQLAWLRNQIARYTYRPGWTLELTTDEGHPVLIVRYPAIDSRDPSQERMFRAHRPVNKWIDSDPALFAEWLKAALLDVERHEFDEWFRRDGQLVDDPHADPTRWQCGCGVVGPVRREGDTWTCPRCKEVSDVEGR